MVNKLTEMALQLLLINRDLPFRLNYNAKTRHSVSDFQLYIFEQVWGSTALGFGGMGGQAMTSANTYVLVPEVEDEKCHVYFGGRYAYSAEWCESFRDDLYKQNMASVNQSAKYRKENQ